MSTVLTVLKTDGTELDHALELRPSLRDTPVLSLVLNVAGFEDHLGVPKITRGDKLKVYYRHWHSLSGKTCLHFFLNGKKPQHKAFVNIGEFRCPEDVTVTGIHVA